MELPLGITDDRRYVFGEDGSGICPIGPMQAQPVPALVVTWPVWEDPIARYFIPP